MITKQQANSVLIMAGGTGGHIFPALAVANALLQQGVHVHWLGTHYGLEGKIVAAANIPISFVVAAPLRGKSWFTKLLMPIKLLIALLQSLRIIVKVNPAVVLGMGGYVTAPGGIAAKLLKKKLLVHEQNAVLGMTNRKLASLAQICLQAFPATFPTKYTAITIGNPVRTDILAIAAPAQRWQTAAQTTLRVLVLGGSQGAHVLNQTIPAAIAKLSTTAEVQVWHQAGQQEGPNVLADYQKFNIDARVDAFIEDMAHAYSWANVVIARAGAMTISELTAVGIASVLIPFPYAVDDHQTKNAEYLVDAGAALLLPQTELTADKLCELLQTFAMNPQLLLQFANNARTLRQSEATMKVVNLILTNLGLRG